MKKIFVILLSMLLLLSVASSAFAQPSYIGVEIGGRKDDQNSQVNQIILGANVNLNLSSKLALGVKAISHINSDNDFHYAVGQLDLKFKVIDLPSFNLGVSVGSNMEYDIPVNKFAQIGITAGAFADVTILEVLTIYADAKVVIAGILPNLVWMPMHEEGAKVDIMGSAGLIYRAIPFLGIKGEVSYQAENLFFTLGLGLTF